MSETRPRVLVYSSFALKPSYRFVIQPFPYMARWRPTLLAAGRDPNTLDLSDVDLVTLDPPRPRRLWWAMRRLRGLARRPSAADVRRVRALDAQLLHAHFGPEGVLVAPLAQAAGLPLLVTLHGYDIQQDDAYWASGTKGLWHRDYPQRLRRIGEEGAHFVAVSEAVARRAVAWGLPAERVHVQPIGVDTHAFHPSGVPFAERPANVVFVGNHIPRKGAPHLIRAMAQVRASVPEAHLHLVGEGPERDAWIRLAAEHDVPATFHGRLPPSGVREVLSDAVALVLPTVRQGPHDMGPPEGFGLVVIEAAAMGVPVVTSAQGRDSEGVRHGQTGFAVEEGDEHAIATHLTTLLTDRALAQRMADAAPEHVRANYDIRACTAGLEALYDRVAGLTGDGR